MHKKVLIRPLAIEDAQISYRWRNDPEVWKYTGNSPNILVTESVEAKWLIERLKEKNSVRFAIMVDDVYVGNIQLTDIIERKNAEYHVFIGEKSYWGQGIASLATAQILHYAKHTLNLEEIYLSVNSKNLSAIRVYEKSGFVESGKDNGAVLMKLSLNNLQTPMVSVFMMTYNHEKYIVDALNGALMQKTNFDFDIVIGEDCSTDNTRQIILEYQKQYPGKFKLLLHKKNIGAMANQNAVFAACTGKYIALCEGDDYWTAPLKLQKQVDFLEKNEDFALCFTNTLIRDHQTGKEEIAKKMIWDTATTKVLLKHNSLDGAKAGEVINSPGHTSSVMFRNGLIQKLPEWYYTSYIGDEPLFLMLSKYGKAKFINDITSVYRQTMQGISTTNFSFERDYIGRIEMYQNINKYFNKRYKNEIHQLIARYYIKLTRLYIHQRRYLDVFYGVLRVLYYDMSIIKK